MPATNGRADTVGAPIQLGDFLPERRQIVLNGQTYLAWVATNKRYPRSVMARLDRAARVYNRVVGPLLETQVQPEAALPALAREVIDYATEHPKARFNDSDVTTLLDQLGKALLLPIVPVAMDERIKAMDEQPEAWENYVSECVMLLVPGLLESEIELIGLDVLEGLLKDIGYFRDTSTDPVKKGSDEEAPPLTGAIVPDDLPTSIPDTTPINN